MLTFADGRKVKRLGEGTWYLGEDPRRETEEIAALRAGLDAGIELIDTAEMYGDGLAESLVGKAIQGRDREKLYLVSKVYPFNAGRADVFDCCDASLARMGVEQLDLYLLHWRGGVPLRETVECMEELIACGKIRRWGVSNFDTADMEELFRVKNGEHCAVNQVLYNLGDRGIEYSLLPWMRNNGVTAMAYCPLAQAGRLRHGLVNAPAVTQVAAAHGASLYEVLLAFVLRDKNVIAIPRTGNPAHAMENARADSMILSDADLAVLEAAFPAPSRKLPLSIV